MEKEGQKSTNPRRNTKFRTTWWDYVCSIFFVGIWLLPILYVGLSHGAVKGAGLYLNNQYRVACLFTRSVRHWGDFYYLIHLKGDENWIVAPADMFSKMEPFGHRTRLHRLLTESMKQSHGMLQRQRMASYIRRRYMQMAPGSKRINAVTFVKSYRFTGDELAQEKGHWLKRNYSQVPRNHKKVISVHFFDGRHPHNDKRETVKLTRRKKREW